MKKYILRWFSRTKFYKQMEQQIEQNLVARLGLHRIDDIEPEDISIIGFPKSGHTWFNNLLVGTVFGIDVRNIPQSIINVFIFPLRDGYYRRYQTPSYFKSHLLPQPYHRRVVYLIRDGRDVMVSYYHYRHALGDNVTWEEHIKNPTPYGYWHEHIQRWLDNPYQTDVLTIKYEDLKTIPIKQLQRFCEFAGIERDIEQLQWAIDNAAFDKMQQREERFGMPNNFPRDKRFVRRGKVGSYKDEMPPEMLDVFMKYAGAMLRQLGYLDGE